MSELASKDECVYCMYSTVLYVFYMFLFLSLWSRREMNEDDDEIFLCFSVFLFFGL